MNDLALTVFALWGLGCLLLLALSVIPRLRLTVASLWPLMLSELLIIAIGLLPWFLPDPLLGLALGLAGARIGYEAGRVLGPKDRSAFAYVVAAGFGSVAFLIWQAGPHSNIVLTLSLVLAAVLGALTALIMWRRAVPPLVAILAFPGLPFLAFVTVARDGAALLLVLAFLTVELFDSFSLLGGKLFGRHLLAPILSPRKTWEGLLTGAVMTIFCMLLVALALDLPVRPLLNSTVLTILAAIVGDVTASSAKRKSGVKDYPVLISIQGGLLDIVDAWLLAGPVAVAAPFLIPGK